MSGTLLSGPSSWKVLSPVTDPPFRQTLPGLRSWEQGGVCVSEEKGVVSSEHGGPGSSPCLFQWAWLLLGPFAFSPCLQ